MCLRFHAREPAVGLVEVTTFPTPSTAAQKCCEGHETAVSDPPGSTVVERQEVDSPVGRVDATTAPAPSTATQSEVDGQLPAVSSLLPGPTTPGCRPRPLSMRRRRPSDRSS